MRIPQDSRYSSLLTTCADGIIRNILLQKCLSCGQKTIQVEGALHQLEDEASAALESPDVVDFQAGVGSGVHITASSVFNDGFHAAIALSNKICKFVRIPIVNEANTSGAQEVFHGSSDVSAVNFIPTDLSRKLYTLAFICNHPKPNSVSISALNLCSSILVSDTETACIHQFSGLPCCGPKRSF